MGSFPLGGIEITDNDFGSVDLLNTAYDSANYVPNAGAQPGGQDGLTDPKGMLLMRAVAGVDLIPWTPLKTSQPVAVLGSDVVHPSGGAVALTITAIFEGQVRRNKLVYFDVTAGTYPLLSTLSGVDPIPTPEEAYDLLRQSGIFALSTLELDRFDNPNNP